MGLPWPPPWESGAGCTVCVDVIFDGRTPVFIYAFAQDIIKCPGVGPLVPDPNRVLRLIQNPVNPCQWRQFYSDGTWQYFYVLQLTGVASFFFIDDTSGMPIFKDTINTKCQDHFENEWNCDDPGTPGFSGGTVDCFWGF